jgi:hypothetical protein
MDWESGLAIEAVTGLDHVVLHVTPNAVLRTEQRAQIDIRMVMQQVSRVTIRVIDRCLIADQTNTRATKVRMTIFK